MTETSPAPEESGAGIQHARDKSGLQGFIKGNLWMAGLLGVVLFIAPLVVPTSFASTWGLAFAFGTPVRVQLPSSCKVETTIRSGARSSVATCDGATWTVRGQRVTGTFKADGMDVAEDGSGNLVFNAKARTIGGSAYGDPGSGRVVASTTLLFALLTGVIAAAGAMLTRAIRAGRRTATRASEDSVMNVVRAEAALIVCALGVSMTFFSSALPGTIVGIVITAVPAVVGLADRYL